MRTDIPVWEKYNQTIEEAADYFQIGINKMRTIVNSNRHADFILWNGTKALIKRKRFEDYIDKCTSI